MTVIFRAFYLQALHIQPLHIQALQRLGRGMAAAGLPLLLALLTLPLHADTAATVNSTTDPSPRLVSTDAGATELLFALGMGEHLVAVDVTSQLPPGHGDLPSVGYHRNLSAEGLLSLNPSAVIGSEHMGPPPVLDALRSAEVKLVQLPSATTSEQLLTNIATLGNALGQTQRANALQAQVRGQLASLQPLTLDGETVAVLLVMDQQMRLAGRDTAGDALIDLLGGRNVVDYLNYRSVTAESLLTLDPDLILVIRQQGQDAARQLLANNPVLRHSRAAKSGRVLNVNGSDLVAGLSVGAIDQALALLKQLHGAVTAAR